MIDIHTHILPGLDDGAKTLNESIQMVQQALDVGVSAICATPHILDGVSSSLEEQINRAFTLLRSQLVKRKMTTRLVLGSEIYIRPDIESLRNFSFFSLNQTNKYVLVELPRGGLPSGVDQLIHSLQLEGLTCIIAHPERCLIGKDPLSEINNMVNQGALIQINAGSILGHFGKEARKTAESLLEYNLVHFMASDAHNASSASITVLFQALEKLCQLVGKIKTEELVIHNPSKVLEGKSLWSNEKDTNVGEKPSLEERGLSEISP
jgi:protein-tyrosine phosphatase